MGYSFFTLGGVRSWPNGPFWILWAPDHPIDAGEKPLKTLSPIVLVFLILMGTAAPYLEAREHGESPIFRRFSKNRETVTNRMVMIEVPVLLRPQNYSDAEILENLGLGYVLALSPKNQVFTAIGLNWARIEFKPSNPEVQVIDVKQIDISQSLNFWLWRTVAIGLGAGFGIMDTFVILAEGTAEHQTVAYVPLQIGLIVPLWGRVSLGLRLVHTPFMGSGAASGNTRLLFGIGGSF